MLTSKLPMQKDIYILEVNKKEFEGSDKKMVTYYRSTIVMDGKLLTDFPVDATLGRALEAAGALDRSLADLLDDLGFKSSFVTLSVSDEAKLKLKEINATKSINNSL